MKQSNDMATVGMGTWKKTNNKKHQHTGASKAKTYISYPPPDGWTGGLPEKNGWKPGKSGK